MSKKHRRASSDDEVQLNMAAMLDMAFQLLAFFILTFRPPGAEWAIELNMPDAVPDMKRDGQAAAGSDFNSKEFLKDLKQLTVFLYADANGELGRVLVGGADVLEKARKKKEAAEGQPVELTQPEKLKLLSDGIQSLLIDDANASDCVVLMVGKTMHYGVLMKVMESCSKLKYKHTEEGTNNKSELPLTKLTFLPINEDPEPSAKK